MTGGSPMGLPPHGKGMTGMTGMTYFFFIVHLLGSVNGPDSLASMLGYPWREGAKFMAVFASFELFFWVFKCELLAVCKLLWWGKPGKPPMSRQFIRSEFLNSNQFGALRMAGLKLEMAMKALQM